MLSYLQDNKLTCHVFLSLSLYDCLHILYPFKFISIFISISSTPIYKHETSGPGTQIGTKSQDTLKVWDEIIQDLLEEKHCKVNSSGGQDCRHVGDEVSEGPSIFSLALARVIVSVSYWVQLGAFRDGITGGN